MNIHQDTWMRLEELGTRFPDYHPTFDFEGDFIDAAHRYFAECPVKDGVLVQVRNRFWFNAPIRGFLRRADALKLYELAHFAPGDILELGAFQGLSTCILSQANRDSPSRKRIVSVDLSALRVFQTLFNLQTMGLRRDVQLIRADAATAIRRLARDRREFAFVFVDHSHAYEPVYAVCRELRTILRPGGFCLFHDFNDPRNREAQDQDYDVYTAVTEGLNAGEFEFCGIYGCAALYRATY
jgi:predicted O-methyltransferase YrrM